jgi:hypothetical protein
MSKKKMVRTPARIAIFSDASVEIGDFPRMP